LRHAPALDRAPSRGNSEGSQCGDETLDIKCVVPDIRRDPEIPSPRARVDRSCRQTLSGASHVRQRQADKVSRPAAIRQETRKLRAYPGNDARIVCEDT